MLKSSFTGKRIRYLIVPALLLSASIYSFTVNAITSKQEALLWASKCLLQSVNTQAEPKLKKWNLALTPEAFIRFKKIYQSGRQEYYSLNLHKFKQLDYFGTNTSGILCIKTLADDVIVQTYNDPNGNVDSMSTSLQIPVKGLEAKQLDSLRMNLIYLKSN